MARIINRFIVSAGDLQYLRGVIKIAQSKCPINDNPNGEISYEALDLALKRIDRVEKHNGVTRPVH